MIKYNIVARALSEQLVEPFYYIIISQRRSLRL
jgi:hypothetical protein